MRSSLQAERILGWLLPVLAVAAEGAFLAVIYVAIETAVDHQPPLLGTLELAAAAGLAAVAVRRDWIDPDDDPVAFLGFLAVLGAVGWLWDADVRALVLSGDPVAALPLHPGGWLLVAAGMRGVGRGLEIDDRAITRLVLVGIPALAIPWIIGQLGSGDLRQVFTEEAFVASLTFVTAGFIAAGLARLREIGRETGVDWRHNRSWLGTVFGVLAVVLALGIPAAMLLGLPGDAVARGILGPILSLLGYLFVAAATVAALTAAVLAAALRTIGLQLPAPMTPEEIARLQEVPTYTLEEIRGPLTGLIVLWVVIIVVLLVLARVWLRRRSGHARRGVTEERSFRLPQRSSRVRPTRVPRVAQRRRGEPTDAVTAYLASLDDLAERRPADARAEQETPRAHAARVRIGAELDALQADYALVRYGGRTLTDAEQRRALGRWQRLRRRLRSA
ncbi:MAG: DUF4129 domain-containing protein [Chloroflexota bacterium]|nr:DUF4129 domain-containing protein [Chloroflexota bacterium]